MGFFKKIKCDHEWSQTHTGKQIGLFNKVFDTIHIYCPKCDKSRCLDDEGQILEWIVFQKEREIKRLYEANTKQLAPTK